MTTIGWERVIKRAYERFSSQEEDAVNYEEFREAVLAVFETFLNHIRHGLFPTIRLKYFGKFIPEDRKIRSEFLKTENILRNRLGKSTAHWYIDYFELLLNHVRNSEHIRQNLPERIEAYDSLLKAHREGIENGNVGSV